MKEKRTMSAVVKGRFAGARLREVKVPKVGPRDVLVKVHAAGLCGSDLRKYRWAPEKGTPTFKLPITLGHEFGGVVVSCGSKVRNVQVGDHVAGEPHIPCGICYQCRSGQPHICANLRIIGSHVNGCFADYILVPAVCARELPQDISFETGAILEPFGVGVHAAEKGRVNGQNVLILGCGPIGLFAGMAARALGAKRILGSEVNPFRLALAKKVGLKEVLNPKKNDLLAYALEATNGVGVDVVIEASGSPAAFKEGLSALRKGGRMVVVGMSSQPVELDVRHHLIYKEATICGIHGREMFKTWETAERLILEGSVDPAMVITHRFALEDFQKAFELALTGRCGKALLLP